MLLAQRRVMLIEIEFMIYFNSQKLFIFAVTNCFVNNLYLETFFGVNYESGLALILLPLNHYNSVLGAFSNLIRTSEIFKPLQYGCCRPHSWPQECHGGRKTIA